MITLRPYCLLLLLLEGCSTLIPDRYQLAVPAACAAPHAAVLLRDDGNPGNAYVIQFAAMTNAAALITNRWPVMRCHVDLSLDGGLTWPRRIGYGIPRDPDGIGGSFVWSPPEDYSLLTSNARMRCVYLDGSNTPWHSSTNMPYDLRPGTDLMSPVFQIGGSTITYPSAGTITWRGSQCNLAWKQMASGAVQSVYWLTPTDYGIDNAHWITTISNAVEGANTHYISLSVPAAPQIKLAIVSAWDGRIIGYSPVFEVDP